MTTPTPPPSPLPLLEYYETPAAFTRMGLRSLAHALAPTGLAVPGVDAHASPVPTLLEPCVGRGAILQAWQPSPHRLLTARNWRTNDRDPRWHADTHLDATAPEVWRAQAAHRPAWVITNPPFSAAATILQHALHHVTCGVIFHVRMSFNEVTKDDGRGALLYQCPPRGLCFLPRFAFRRSPTTHKWSTDSVATCWMYWLTSPDYDAVEPWIHYADDTCLQELVQETPDYRDRMDRLTQGAPS